MIDADRLKKQTLYLLMLFSKYTLLEWKLVAKNLPQTLNNFEFSRGFYPRGIFLVCVFLWLAFLLAGLFRSSMKKVLNLRKSSTTKFKMGLTERCFSDYSYSVYFTSSYRASQLKQQFSFSEQCI